MRILTSPPARLVRGAFVALSVSALAASFAASAAAPRQMENLGRGLVGLNQGDGKVTLSWRLLGTEPESVAFNVYRAAEGAAPLKLNAAPLTGATFFTDPAADLTKGAAYFVRAVHDGQEGADSAPFRFPAGAPVRPYLSIPLQPPAGYGANDCSVGDLDGDGELELIVHLTGRGQDNAFAGTTTEPVFQAYKLDGTRLWTINLGKNIREGAHYTQFMVYDLDGDGRAELVCKTADGTIDGTGQVIGDAAADWREPAGDAAVPSRDRTGSSKDAAGAMVAKLEGRILRGPEFLTVFDGRTGRALATVDYVPGRGDVAAWGDAYANRSDRHLACVAYLDGERPSVVMCRGYYTRTVLAAWDWRDGKLSQRWVFDSDSSEANRKFAGQGNHNLSVADVDGDGRDEIVYGACTIDDDGTGLYSTGLGHGDALHVSDLDPTHPGLEVFAIHEHVRHEHGTNLRDARTGEILWSKKSPDVGRGVAIDLDPRHPGAECWASGEGLGGLWSVKGEKISERKPRSCNFAVWWDGDLLREILDSNRITKWDWNTSSETPLLVADGCAANNSTKSNPCLSGDILGDWREEVVWRTADSSELRIYTTPLPTEHRLVTLLHDPQYRLALAWQNVAYNQPPHPGFYLGDGMAPPPRAAIRTVRAK